MNHTNNTRISEESMTKCWKVVLSSNKGHLFLPFQLRAAAASQFQCLQSPRGQEKKQTDCSIRCRRGWKETSSFLSLRFPPLESWKNNGDCCFFSLFLFGDQLATSLSAYSRGLWKLLKWTRMRASHWVKRALLVNDHAGQGKEKVPLTPVIIHSYYSILYNL